MQLERQAERYHAQDLARMDELMNQAEQKELVREIVEALPADHAYFVQSNDLKPHHNQRHHAVPHIIAASNDDDYFEQQPRHESIRFTNLMVKKSMPVQPALSDDSGSSETSLEQEIPVAIENNPLENFLESLVVSPSQSSEEETSGSSSSSEVQEEKPVKWNEKRTYVAPEPIEERPESGLIDLITNTGQAYYNGQDSDEDSGEKQILILSPSASSLWGQPEEQEQWQTESQEVQEPAYKPSMGGLVDLLAARMRGSVQQEPASNEYEINRHHQKPTGTSNMWLNEEKSVITPLTKENGLSAWQNVPNQSKKKFFFFKLKYNFIHSIVFHFLKLMTREH